MLQTCQYIRGHLSIHLVAHCLPRPSAPFGSDWVCRLHTRHRKTPDTRFLTLHLAFTSASGPLLNLGTDISQVLRTCIGNSRPPAEAIPGPRLQLSTPRLHQANAAGTVQRSSSPIAASRATSQQGQPPTADDLSVLRCCHSTLLHQLSQQRTSAHSTTSYAARLRLATAPYQNKTNRSVSSDTSWTASAHALLTTHTHTHTYTIHADHASHERRLTHCRPRTTDHRPQATASLTTDHRPRLAYHERVRDGVARVWASAHPAALCRTRARTHTTDCTTSRELSLCFESLHGPWRSTLSDCSARQLLTRTLLGASHWPHWTAS